MEKIVYRKILVPFDGSDIALVAIPHAISLAILAHSEIVLLHVIKPIKQEFMMTNPLDLYSSLSAFGVSMTEIDKEIKKSAAYGLAKLKDNLEAQGVRFAKTRVELGEPKETIVNIAKTEGCDLIVMSTHGRSGLGRALLGSVADYVIRYAACPVLVIHPSKKVYKEGR